MRVTLTVLVLAGSLTAPALAAPKPVARCTVVTDAADDAGVAGSPAAVPAGSVDVRSVRMETYSSGVAVTIANAPLDRQRRAIWRLTFAGPKASSLYVAAGTGVWANVGDGDTLAGFRAGVEGQRAHAVHGDIDYLTGTVRMRVPFDAFGRLVRRGTVLSSFAIEAKETFVTVAPTIGTDMDAEIKLSDTATSTRTFTVGRTC